MFAERTVGALARFARHGSRAAAARHNEQLGSFRWERPPGGAQGGGLQPEPEGAFLPTFRLGLDLRASVEEQLLPLLSGNGQHDGSRMKTRVTRHNHFSFFTSWPILVCQILKSFVDFFLLLVSGFRHGYGVGMKICDVDVVGGGGEVGKHTAEYNLPKVR